MVVFWSCIAPINISFEADIELSTEIRVTNAFNNLPKLTVIRKINKEKSIAAIIPMILNAILFFSFLKLQLFLVLNLLLFYS